MYIEYTPKNFRAASLSTIEIAGNIIEEYQADGYMLTLRQLYYQFVQRGLIENTMRSYKNLGSLVSDGRLAGLIDWDAIEDRTRNLMGLPSWIDPGGIMTSMAYRFRVDRWANQDVRIEAWVEKEALSGVFSKACSALDVDFFACKGYVSQSEMHAAARRLADYEEGGQETHILYFGDHDPSGIDMTRDIRDRLELFGSNVTVERLALNMDQIEELNPPPNPAKLSDSRSSGYVSEFGFESWELDALEPAVISELITNRVVELRDEEAWEESGEEIEEGRELLKKAARNWKKVAGFVEGL